MVIYHHHLRRSSESSHYHRNRPNITVTHRRVFTAIIITHAAVHGLEHAILYRVIRRIPSLVTAITSGTAIATIVAIIDSVIIIDIVTIINVDLP